jgi:hypothetical protein
MTKQQKSDTRLSQIQKERQEAYKTPWIHDAPMVLSREEDQLVKAKSRQGRVQTSRAR